MKNELPKAYDPSRDERGIYDAWESSGAFRPEARPRAKTKFSMALPPPNTTAELHMGHAVMVAIQDIMTRYHRMKGDQTLWLPGTDHAAIATQNVVEKRLLANGKRKEDLGRDAFLREVNAFVRESQGTIKKQIRRLGASLDWSRERFTLDPGLSKAVRTMFVNMHRDGLIYRGNRIVNWCPRCASTLADDEVEYKETKAPFYYLKYGPVVIGTARPETKFQDKTIVVHPDDSRYRDLVGKTFSVDWIEGIVDARVIADPSADPNFGTGAMTLTPAHSFLDFELAKKYGLPVIQIINEQGRLTEAAGSFVGLTTAEARERVVSQLQLKGLIDHIDEQYLHNLSVCYRCGTPVEPLISKQWFIDVHRPVLPYQGALISLKDRALAAVNNKELAILPDRFGAVYRHWIENLRDWCISRQIWYGHQVPVWERPIPRDTGKTWELKLYGADMLNGIASGRKRIETRAGKPEGAEKDWRLFKPGDWIRFTGVNPKNEEPLGLPDVTKRIGSIRHFTSPEEMLRHIPLEDIAPGYSPESYTYHSSHFPGYKERIEKYGIWAFELIDRHAEVQETFVGLNAPKGKGWTQETDTLDTWFSSGLWTFSTLGWPDTVRNGKKTGDLARFHPTSVLETGYDILFFWVARMILMSTYALGEVPFNTVYLHGLVRDAHGRKMSKSLGNGIDPLKMAEQYGADATRLSLVIGTAAGNDLRLSEAKVAGQRNFVNKLWNIARFALLQGAHSAPSVARPRTLADSWILSRLNHVVADTTADLEHYRFSAAAERVYAFAWHDFADWYLEIAKVEPNLGVTRLVLSTILKLLHPFLPFSTERLWRELEPGGPQLIVSDWPTVQANRINEGVEREFTKLQRTIGLLRTFKVQSGLLSSEAGISRSRAKDLVLISRLTGISIHDQKPEHEVSELRFGTLRISFPVARVNAFESWRTKELERLSGLIEKKRSGLTNPRLPEEVRQQTQLQLAELEQQQRELNDHAH